MNPQDTTNDAFSPNPTFTGQITCPDILAQLCQLRAAWHTDEVKWQTAAGLAERAGDTDLAGMDKARAHELKRCAIDLTRLIDQFTPCESPSIKPGDVVVLASGGPEMTVVRISDSPGEVITTWFHYSSLQREFFPLASLQIVKP
jgi:uncharacterized protein YodC (DUF2158 family)